MNRLIVVLCLLGLGPKVSAQESLPPDIIKFAQDITGTIWDFRGTYNLKHLRFDGEEVREIDDSGEPRSNYDYAFVDDGVFRLDYRGPRTGWYFVSEDRKWVTPLTVDGEILLRPSEGTETKPVNQFPQDITGIVWETLTDERNLQPMRFRWSGNALEIAAKNGDAWQAEKHVPVVANRRVLEVQLADPNMGVSVIWLVFGKDGTKAWLLQLNSIFGGHAREVPAQANGTIEGLSPQHNDLANHALDLLGAGETMLAATIRRQLLRRLAEEPGLMKAVQQRLGGE